MKSFKLLSVALLLACSTQMFGMFNRFSQLARRTALAAGVTTSTGVVAQKLTDSDMQSAVSNAVADAVKQDAQAAKDKALSNYNSTPRFGRYESYYGMPWIDKGYVNPDGAVVFDDASKDMVTKPNCVWSLWMSNDADTAFEKCKMQATANTWLFKRLLGKTYSQQLSTCAKQRNEKARHEEAAKRLVASTPVGAVKGAWDEYDKCDRMHKGGFHCLDRFNEQTDSLYQQSLQQREASQLDNDVVCLEGACYNGTMLKWLHKHSGMPKS